MDLHCKIKCHCVGVDSGGIGDDTIPCIVCIANAKRLFCGMISEICTFMKHFWCVAVLGAKRLLPQDANGKYTDNEMICTYTFSAITVKVSVAFRRFLQSRRIQLIRRFLRQPTFAV